MDAVEAPVFHWIFDPAFVLKVSDSPKQIGFFDALDPIKGRNEAFCFRMKLKETSHIRVSRTSKELGWGKVT